MESFSVQSQMSALPSDSLNLFLQCYGVEVDPRTETNGYILNGTCGSNDKNVSVSALFADQKPENGLSCLDLTRYRRLLLFIP